MACPSQVTIVEPTSHEVAPSLSLKGNSPLHPSRACRLYCPYLANCEGASSWLRWKYPPVGAPTPQFSGENQCLRARPARTYTSSTQSDLHTTIIISAPVFTDLAEPLSSAVALTRLHSFSRRRPSLAHYGTIIAYHWLCLLVTHTDPLVPLSFMPRWASHSVWAPLCFALAAWRVVVLGC